MSTREAALVACDITSRRCLVAIDHCHVAAARTRVISSIGRLTMRGRHVLPNGCEVAFERHDVTSEGRHVKSLHYDATPERRDVTMVLNEAARVWCAPALGIRTVGMMPRVVTSSMRDLTTDGCDLCTWSLEVSSRWRLVPSRSRDLRTDRCEVALAGCEVSSRLCLAAIDPCLVTIAGARVMSSIDGLTLSWCRVIPNTCAVAFG